METTDSVRLLAAAMAFAAAALCYPGLYAAVQRAKAAGRANRAAIVGERGSLARILRNGIAPASAMARAASRVPAAASYLAEIAWLARSRGYETDSERVGGVVFVAAGVSFAFGWLATASPVFGLMLAACFVVGLGIAARHTRERELEAMRESVPEMLHAMSACRHAGYSLLQSFHHLAQEMTGPLGRLFERAESDLATGRTVPEALQRLRRDSSLPELAFVTAALEIQHQTGGSLQKIIDSACDSVEGELALRRSLRVQTAQARLSMRLITIMPFVLIGLFSLISPGFLAPFFASALGLAVLGVAMGMQLAGVLAVRRMLDVGEV